MRSFPRLSFHSNHVFGLRQLAGAMACSCGFFSSAMTSANPVSSSVQSENSLRSSRRSVCVVQSAVSYLERGERWAAAAHARACRAVD
jgi:hypothetical protein